MWRIVWSETWSVGIDELDEQHRSFLGFVESLEQAIADRKDKDIISALLTEVITGTTDHFRHEECILAESGYPGADAHRVEHHRLETMIAERAEVFRKSDSRDEWSEAAQQIKTALLNHLVRFDMNYKWFFRDSPARIPASVGRHPG